MNTKLKCLLLDDELPSLSYLKLLCEQLPGVEVVKAFNDPLDFMNEFARIDFDLLITDIEMPNMKGIELVEHIKEKAVIFTTAYGEYAADAFDLQVIDYVRKPLQLERLRQAIKKVQLWHNKALHRQKTFIQVNSDKGKYLLHFDQIRFITTSALDSRDKVVYLDNGSQITLKNISFQTLEEAWPSTDFCRINKKEIIAMQIVSAFSHDEISTTLLLENGQARTCSLSEKYKMDFLQKIAL
ncbi:response regulator transcription factor [Sphingobacterium oryzagri]|uniref:Response regulator transcription factor n=1 Tax=Sphingobacterium oryzagri TaxID=3025669 RepID=A0ABY7WNC6_9SPHI|nr:response regulator transcription factor [Sphingobacterium sp. KACC 22765]WDF70044.1 response regulator transcription factor [Sphingobacterium sp. KACC 22765]